MSRVRQNEEGRFFGNGWSTAVTTLPAEQMDADDLHVEGDLQDGRATLRLVGEVDFYNAGRLGEAMEDLQRSGASTIVVDMARLEFIDSSGLHQLVRALRRQRESDGDVMLRAPKPSTRRVLDIVGLSEVFTIL